MRKKISTKLKILLCFGVILFTVLGFSPTTASAHNSATGGRVPFQVYDGDTPWDDTYVGWFEHDKKVSSTTKWYTQAYHVTTYSVPGCYVPADSYLVGTYNDFSSLDCTESGFVDTGVLFNKWKVMDWAAHAGATFDNDGMLTVWLQPTIGIKTKNSSGGWDDAGVSLTNLYDWTTARRWANTSTFAGHYNKPLHLKYQVPGGVTVKYQTLNAGDGYNGRQDILPNASYSYNLGSVHSYSETGIKSHIDWSSKRMVLVGVEVTKDG
ncbi:MAG: hypothetical protein MR427_12010, partial [Roseburia sp.]|nr:hypothetical protein [Roseburia sp.]